MRKFLSVFVPSNIRTAVMLALQIAMVFAIMTLHPVWLVSFILGLASFAIIESRKKQMSTDYKKMMIIIAGSAAIILPINVFYNANTVFHFIILFFCLFSAFYAGSNIDDYTTSSRLLLTIFQIYLVLFILSKGVDGFPLEEVLKETSSNAITSSLICLQINYSISTMIRNGKVSIFSSAVTLWVCLVGYGRGSIIASSGIFFLNVALLALSTRIFIVRLAFLVFSGFLVLYALQNAAQIYDYLNANTKIGSGLFDQERYIINSAYFGELGGSNILTGVDIRGSIIEHFYNGNTHNSFIRAHMIFGLIYLVATLVVIVIALLKVQGMVARFYCSVLIALLFFRAGSEPILFPTTYDFIYFSIISIMLTQSISYSKDTFRQKKLPSAALSVFA